MPQAPGQRNCSLPTSLQMRVWSHNKPSGCGISSLEFIPWISLALPGVMFRFEIFPLATQLWFKVARENLRFGGQVCLWQVWFPIAFFEWSMICIIESCWWSSCLLLKFQRSLASINPEGISRHHGRLPPTKAEQSYDRSPHHHQSAMAESRSWEGRGPLNLVLEDLLRFMFCVWR